VLDEPTVSRKPDARSPVNVPPPPLPPPPAGVGLGRITDAEAARCRPLATAPAPTLRRLNRWEYDNTVRDLLGDTTRPGSGFPVEERALGFDNNAAALTVPPALVEAYASAAEALANRAVTNLPALVPCAAAGGPDCARSFITTFGRRAYRRTLTPAEVASLSRVFEVGAQTDFRTGIRLVVTTFLQSASFLYRLERGGTLSGAELASRLSYFLWGTMPDEPLLDAAERGALVTPAQVKVQVTRMLADAKAKEGLGRFLRLWLGLDHVSDLDKDPALFADYTPAVARAMEEEARLFIEAGAAEEDTSLAGLLTSKHTFADATLARFYGATAPASGFGRLQLDGGRRSGILTLGPFLASHSTATESSPVRRGTFVREHLLCDQLPDPPDDVPDLPAIEKGISTRERFARHSQDPSCAACHSLVDPIGFGLEAFDAVGRWRERDAGRPIDASGALLASEADGPFVGAAELGQRLAGSNKVARCAVTNLFRYAHARGETPEDACSLHALDQRFLVGNLRIRDLVLALVDSDLFRAPAAIEGGRP
jgi:hypothetical protein